MRDVPERPVEPPAEEEPIEPRCPICCKTCDTFHIDKYHEIVGCENCLSAVDAWDWVYV